MTASAQRPGALRRALDRFYAGCGILAGISLVAIGVLILMQIAARLLGSPLTWTDEFAGYAMASSSFLALAYTFNSGGHIRVSMLLDVMPPAGKRGLDALCLLIGIGIAGIFAWHTVILTWQSYAFNDMGQGIVPVPLWIPQISMTLGVGALLVALVDGLLRVVTDNPLYQDRAAPSVT